MKMMSMRTLMFAVLLLVALTFDVMAQGSLTPPGAPAPTMKTLNQVEPRIPIPGGNSTYTISSRGSYYLVTNMTQTLTIDADNVTVDLMGYTIDPPAGDDAISIPATQKNLWIRNGTLTGGGTGVDARYLRNSNSRFEDLIVSDFTYCGLYIGSDCLVQNCLLLSNGTYGIQSSSAGKLEVRNCRVIDTAGDGIEADDESVVVGNTVEGSGGYGVQLDGTGCYMAENLVRGNAENYDLGSGNQLNLLLCEVPQVLAWPCAVKFIGDLSTSLSSTNGINANANNITIDLDGHALIGPGSTSGYGIYQSSSYEHLTVRNGTIQGWRGSARAGILCDGTRNLIEGITVATNYSGFNLERENVIRNCIAKDNANDGIRVTDGNLIQGCSSFHNADYGISMGDDNVVDDCVLWDNRYSGVLGGSGNVIKNCAAADNDDSGMYLGRHNVVKDCTTRNNGEYGIRVYLESTIESCCAATNGLHGIYSEYRAEILSCVTSDNEQDGIHAGERSHVKDCTSTFNNETGIWVDQGSLVSGCTAQFGNSTGIFAVANCSIKNSHVSDNDVGIVTGYSCEVLDCSAIDNNGDGINVGNYVAVVRCTANANTGDGIEAASSANIVDCTCNNNGYSSADGAGVHVTGSSGVIDGNTVKDNDRGIDVDGLGNLIVRNRSNSGVDYDIAANNHVAAIVTCPDSAAISGSSGGSGVGTTDPWDNFAY